MNVKKLYRRTTIQFISAIIIYTASYISIYYLVYTLYHRQIYFSYDRIYRIIHFFDEYPEIAIFLVIVGYLLIFIYFLGKPFSYLLELSKAASSIYSEDYETIELSEPLKAMENTINNAKIKFHNNERIAREAEQRKNDLITYLAHDLKTPITSVIGYLMLLRDEPDISPKMREKYTNIALDKAERLESLINEFFDITRFNLSRITLETEHINLSRMLEQITYEFLPILDSKNLTWEISIDDNIEITGDADKLERVFDNLIRNAINYSYKDTPLKLSLIKKVKDKKEGIQLTIENKGKTIPKEKLERIFEQFFRLDTSRATASGGAGLGLAIAKEIVELHEGNIYAASENECIVFTVWLPC